MEKVNISKAMANPAGVFGNPDKVLDDKSLSQSQKREVLNRWKEEAIHLQESAAEGFDGGEQSRIDEITAALEKLS